MSILRWSVKTNKNKLLRNIQLQIHLFLMPYARRGDRQFADFKFQKHEWPLEHLVWWNFYLARKLKNALFKQSNKTTFKKATQRAPLECMILLYISCFFFRLKFFWLLSNWHGLLSRLQIVVLNLDKFEYYFVHCFNLHYIKTISVKNDPHNLNTIWTILLSRW